MYSNDYQSLILAQGKIDQFMREANHYNLVKLARQGRKSNKQNVRTVSISGKIASLTR